MSGCTLDGAAIETVLVPSARFARPGCDARETRRTWAITPGGITERSVAIIRSRRERSVRDQVGPLRISAVGEFYSFRHSPSLPYGASLRIASFPWVGCISHLRDSDTRRLCSTSFFFFSIVNLYPTCSRFVPLCLSFILYTWYCNASFHVGRWAPQEYFPFVRLLQAEACRTRYRSGIHGAW